MSLAMLAGAGMTAPPVLQWLPVSSAELALKASRVEKDAGAEALFWRVYVFDEAQGQDVRTVLFHYLRVKIFNDRGKSSKARSRFRTWERRPSAGSPAGR